MRNAYDLHSWSRMRHEDALRDARKRPLVELCEAERRQRFGLNRVGAVCRNALLSLLRGTKPVETQ